MKTIKGRLIFSYSFISIVILLSLALFYTVSMENVFSGYAKEQLDEKMRTVVEQMKGFTKWPFGTASDAGW